MINLLTPERKKKLEREYIFRVGTVYLLFLIFVLVIGSVALLPAYFFAHAKEDVVRKEVDGLKASSQSSKVGQAKADLLSVKERLEALSRGGEQTPFYKVLDTLASYVNSSISITNISYTRGTGKTHSSLSLGGTATTREALTTFSQELKSDTLFDSVVLPVSSLAKDKNIDFHIDISGTF